MKAKTIKAVLQKKHNQFFESIEDPEIKKLVKNNSIITGGCIVSMLLNEKVRDFDYYFTDKETCLKVAEYFVKEFNERHKKNIFVREKEDGRIKIFIKSVGIAEDEEYSEPTTEFDDAGLEGLDLDGLKEARDKNEEDRKSYRPVFLSANAISLTGMVQLVVRFYGEPGEIHSNYDFVHCTCYWVSKTGELVLPQKALEAILTKELIYTGSKYPLCSILRAKKFVQRGWQINAGQYVKMALQLNNMDLLDMDTLEEQLTGVDSAYFFQVINYIRERVEKEPDFKIDEMYLIEVINRIF